MKSQNLLITGASTGIGRDATEYLANNNFTVFAGARKKEDLENLSKIKNVIPVKLDVTDVNDVSNVKTLIKSEYGNLFGLINNAGVTFQGPTVELTEEEITEQLDINILGVHRVTKALFPLILESHGRIINIGSTSGKLCLPFIAPYQMSKFALEAYSDTLRRELLPFNVKVSIIEPGGIRTPIWDKINVEDPKYDNSLFEKYVRPFGRYAISQGKKGLEPIEVSKAIYKALTSKKPKNRYLITGNNLRFRIMSNLPSSWFDRMIMNGFKNTDKNINSNPKNKN